MTLFLEMAGIIAQGKPSDGAQLLNMVVMMAIFGGFFYIIIIRPRNMKDKKHMEQVSKLMKGDEVMLAGGIYGTIHSVESDSLLVKIAEKCIIKVHQRSVTVIMKDGKETSSVEENK